MRPLRPEDLTAIGRYRVVGRLGACGMGEVYKGTSPGGRPVAIKVVHRHRLDRDPSSRSRFRREMEAAKRVDGFWTAQVVEGELLALVRERVHRRQRVVGIAVTVPLRPRSATNAA